MKSVTKKGDVYFPTKAMKNSSWINSPLIYKHAHKDSINFWAQHALQGITWHKPFTKAYKEKNPFFKWFLNGKLNFCYNALDRHVNTKPNKIALTWIPEKLTIKTKNYTYSQLHKEVSKFANVLKSLKVKKSDVVCIYLPLIPEVAIAMLACTRIGAIHSVIFSAFSANALNTRLLDTKAKILITSDGFYRKGKSGSLLEKVNQALKGTKVKKTIVVKRLKTSLTLKKSQLSYSKLMSSASEICPPTIVESNHPLFILYTSGTTGKPKGVIHDTGGYATQSFYTTKWNFNLHEDDVMWCTADVGWITGHTYLLYGPLLTGATTLMYEGIPNYPTPARFWQIIKKHKVSAFYTAPTAIRMFKLWGDKFIPKSMPSLKILGTVGEPIDTETWQWYFKKIGKSNLPIIDTWWQTETGANVINALPGIGPFTPGVAGKPFPGINFGIVNEKGKILKHGKGLLIQFPPFAPAMIRGVWGNKKKYKEKYFTLNKKRTKYYITGDSAILNKSGEFKILGRSDDVIKVAGHRLSTAEMEDAAHYHPNIADIAVVSRPDEIKGSAIVIFARLKSPSNNLDKTKTEISKLLEKAIGPIAKPKEIFFVEDLPKTRSGKIMRRILKNLLANKPLGELSTIVNPESIEKIKPLLSKK
jgi:acetyl-CoA synthetase